MPSLRRKTYKTEADEVKKSFSKMWKPVALRMKFNINLLWGQDVINDNIEIGGGKNPPSSTRIVVKGLVTSEDILRTMLDGETPTDEDLYKAFTRFIGPKFIAWSADAALVSTKLRSALPKFRSELLRIYAEHRGEFDTKGGHILGDGYFVNEKEKTK